MLLARHYIVSVSVYVTDLSPSPSVCVCVRACVGLSICLSVQKVYCSKTADWIQMSFGVVSEVSRGMGVLDGVVIIKGKGQFWG